MKSIDVANPQIDGGDLIENGSSCGPGPIAEARARFRGALQTLALAQGLAEKAQAHRRDRRGDAAEKDIKPGTRLESDAGDETSSDQGSRGFDGEPSRHAEALRSKIHAS